MKRETKLAIAATAATAVAATAAAVLTSIKFLADVAVSKTLPPRVYKMQSKLTGENENEELMAQLQQKSEWLKSVASEKVTIKSSDGLTLVGHWYPAQNAKRIVVAMHGWRSNWSIDFSMSAEFLHDCGCSILFADQRSQGESEGEHISFGVLERGDCYNWVDYVVNNLGSSLPVYLYGISMGATTVLMASECEYPPCVRGIISDCGFTSPHAIWSHVMNNNLHISDKIGYPIANYFINKKASFDGDGGLTTDALRKTSLAVLFIHGEDDKFVPVQMTYDNYNACAGEKMMLTVPGAGHGMSFIVDPSTYKAKVLEFFERFDDFE